MTKLTRAITMAILICSAYTVFAGQATVKEEKAVMKTYPFSDPNPVANIGTIYPYFRFEGYSAKAEDQDWKMVVLENPYVKLWITPEIGGKIWGAVEKSTSREFVYFNKVVKFRNIALRGPWTSGGIEFNFGIIGHTPTTATPVDYLYQENPDGSVSCIVGAIDLPSRTWWRVNIRLPGDRASIETECFWFNPMPLHQSFYHWMTAAEDVSEDLRYFYPGTNYIGHGGDAHSWPMVESRDVSFYRNNDFGGSKSYHILGEYDEHFGGYWEERDFGYGHWALYDDKPGQKLWIWSLARDGGIWHDLLTDPEGNAQYTEPQTGLLFNQEAASSTFTPFKHAYFQPLSTSRWKEIWFPIKGIGGLVDGSPYGSLNVVRTKDILRIGICALQNLEEDLTVKVGGKIAAVKKISLKPMDVLLETVQLPDDEGEVTVDVGGNKLFYSSAGKQANTLSRPLILDKDFDWSTAEGLFISGEEFARQRLYPRALEKYLECLIKDPSHSRAKTRLAEIHYRRAEYEKALAYASNVLAIDAYDPGGNFMYGLVNAQLGNLIDAKEAFGWAARSMEYRSAAYTELAGICLQENDLSRAEEYARRSLDYNRFNLSAYQVLSIIHRLGQNRLKAEEVLEQILGLDPLNHLARFEKHLLDQDPKLLEVFNSLIRNELPHETYLEMAMHYLKWGRTDEARQVLKEAPDHPLVDYWLAYLERDREGERSREYLDRALAASPYLVFPFRCEDIPVFRWALSQSGNWKSAYYLALVFWNLGRVEEAGSLLESCGEKPDFAPFYLTRGRLSLDEDQPEKALRDYLKARTLTKEDWRAVHFLIDLYIRLGRVEEALQNAGEFHHRNPDDYVLAMDYARTLLLAGRYEDCLSILQKTTVLPYEGAREGRDVYRQANVLLAAQLMAKGNTEKALEFVGKAREWPERLGVGRPFLVDERLEDFLQAKAYQKTGDKTRAMAAYQKIIEYTVENRTAWSANHCLGLSAFHILGQEEAGQALLEDWKKARPADDPAVRYAEARFANDRRVIETMKNQKTADRELSLLMKIFEILEF